MRPRGAGLVTLFLAACSVYEPGSFRGSTGPFVGRRRTVGCLDVAVAPVREAALRGRAVKYTFANRCDEAVVVDLTAVRAAGMDAQARHMSVRLRDPRGEVRPLALEARTVGVEMLEYEPLWVQDGWGGERRALASLCLDLTGVERVAADVALTAHEGHGAVPVVCVKP